MRQPGKKRSNNAIERLKCCLNPEGLIEQGRASKFSVNTPYLSAEEEAMNKQEEILIKVIVSNKK